MIPLNVCSPSKRALVIGVITITTLGTGHSVFACVDADLKLVSENIRIRMCDGEFRRGEMPSCSRSGEQNCFVRGSNFKSGDVEKIKPENIKTGRTIIETDGAYPSAKFPLGKLGNGESGDPLAITTQGTIKYWDQTGKSHTTKIVHAGEITPGSAAKSFGGANTLVYGLEVAADSNLASENIKAGVEILGVTGLGITSDLTVDPWDLRYGVSFLGQTGKLKTNCRNIANLSAYDGSDLYDGSSSPLLDNSITPGSPNGTADWWDTIDNYWDHKDNSSTNELPNANPWGSDEFLCDATNWEASGTDSGTVAGLCNDLADECIMHERNSNLMWTEDQGGFTWSGAINQCESLNSSGFGGYNSGWRLPTHLEILTAYANGFEYMETAQGDDGIFTYDLYYTDYIWTATTETENGAGGNAFVNLPGFSINLSVGKGWAAPHAFCVRKP